MHVKLLLNIFSIPPLFLLPLLLSTSLVTATLPHGHLDRRGDNDDTSQYPNPQPWQPSNLQLWQPSNPQPWQPSSSASGWRYRNVLYFVNWAVRHEVRPYFPQQIPGGEITHILYGFAKIGDDGEVLSSDPYVDVEKHFASDSSTEMGKNAYGSIKQIYLLKKKYRHLKVLLSIGGWAHSPQIARSASTEDGRVNFCVSAVRLMLDWGFDGLDITWGHLKDEQQKQDFVSLLQTCRVALDLQAGVYADKPHFELTVSTPARLNNYKMLDIAGMDQWLDFWNLMTYNYADAKDEKVGHLSNLRSNPRNLASTPFSTDEALEPYIERGVPAHKIVIGISLYGQAFQKTKGAGFEHDTSGLTFSEYGYGVYPNYMLPRPGAREGWDPQAEASCSYDYSSHEFISHETMRSVTSKAHFVMKRGLGGVMFWEASADSPGALSLVEKATRSFGTLLMQKNLLDYPMSQYANIRKGMGSEQLSPYEGANASDVRGNLRTSPFGQHLPSTLCMGSSSVRRKGSKVLAHAKNATES